MPIARAIRVFTTRPDTLFGATYMVLAPEHPLVDRITTEAQRSRRRSISRGRRRKSDLDRTDLAKTKTGVFTGALRDQPGQRRAIPIWIADYVLMGYGTGAIMAVPGHDERDFEFARAFDLPIVRVVAPSRDQADAPLTQAEAEPGVAVNSRNDEIALDGLPTAEAKGAITAWLERTRTRQEDDQLQAARLALLPPALLGRAVPGRAGRARPHAGRSPSRSCPSACPSSTTSSRPASPSRRLSKATEWVRYSDKSRRETNTMPQWAGSCWYYLRYIDPQNDRAALGPGEENDTGCRSTSTSAGPSTRCSHLLYSRFWHKVLFDRGLVSTAEPFQKLVNQGMILGETEYTGYQDAEGRWAPPVEDEQVGVTGRRRGPASS